MNNASTHILLSVKRFVQAHKIMCQRGILLGLSGGVDSVVLLDVLLRLDMKVTAAHANFQLRGDESDGDEHFVIDVCKRLNVPLHLKRFDALNESERRKQSIQITARQLRYDWFETERRELGFIYIATAHHANDNAETVLQHILQGTGIAGLSGIPPVNGNVIRPLLDVTKDQVLTYAKDHELQHRNDSSNETADYTRNKIRFELLPVLETFNPSVVQTLHENSKRWRDAALVYDAAMLKLKARLRVVSNGSVLINIPSLQAHAATQTLLYELLKDYGFNGSQSEEIFYALDGESGKQFFSATHRVIKDRKHLVVTVKDATSLYHLFEHGSGTAELPAGKLTLETVDHSSDINLQNQRYQYLNADTLQFPLVVRSWKKGDYFYPFGLNKKKKVSDYFTDRKLSLPQKEQQPVLQSGEHIVALPGLCVDHRFRVLPSNKKILKIRLQR